MIRLTDNLVINPDKIQKVERVVSPVNQQPSIRISIEGVLGEIVVEGEKVDDVWNCFVIDCDDFTSGWVSVTCLRQAREIRFLLSGRGSDGRL